MNVDMVIYDKASIIAIYAAINIVVFVCGVLVMMMQTGFMMLETGSLSRKNAINNIFKNFVDICVCGIFFYFFGYPILTGDSIVVDYMREYGLANTTVNTSPGPIITLNENIAIFFNFAFAATCVTICSGSVTGRIATYPYLIFGACFSAFFYPVVAFSVWNPDGALHGVLSDFAGASVVHSVGGFAGLAGAIMLRPRIGEYNYGADLVDEDRLYRAQLSNQPHSVPLSALGVFLLWIGWFGFNAGSTFASGFDLSAVTLGEHLTAPADFAHSVFDQLISVFSQVIINTTLAPCAGVFAVVAFFMLMREKYNMTDILNGALAGLVGITASADAASSAQALLIGGLSGAIYILALLALFKLKIDDPVAAFPVHGAVGLAGVAMRALTVDAADAPVVFGTQLFYGILIAAFSFASAALVFRLSAIFMYNFKELRNSPNRDYEGFPVNHLRVTPEQELNGLDLELHGQSSYHLEHLAPGAAPKPLPQPRSMPRPKPEVEARKDRVTRPLAASLPRDLRKPVDGTTDKPADARRDTAPAAGKDGNKTDAGKDRATSPEDKPAKSGAVVDLKSDAPKSVANDGSAGRPEKKSG